MTAVANLEDELALHRDFERIDASERPRTKREARLEQARELDGKLRALVRIAQQAEAELARALWEMADRGPQPPKARSAGLFHRSRGGDACRFRKGGAACSRGR